MKAANGSSNSRPAGEIRDLTEEERTKLVEVLEQSVARLLDVAMKSNALPVAGWHQPKWTVSGRWRPGR